MLALVLADAELGLLVDRLSAVVVDMLVPAPCVTAQPHPAVDTCQAAASNLALWHTIVVDKTRASACPDKLPGWPLVF